MGMTSASIRYREPNRNRLKYLMALRTFLKDMETLIQKKTPSENGSINFDRYSKIFEQVKQKHIGHKGEQAL